MIKNKFISISDTFCSCRRIHLDCHGHQTQNVRTAVQLLSRSMANSFTLDGRPELAYFISTVNDWFDVMDSRRMYHNYNKNKCGLGVNWDQQEECLRKMLVLTENMVVGKTKRMKTERTNMVAFQKGIICSIQSVLQLWKELKAEGFSHILTHKLNQDCIENLFSAVRGMGGADTNPTPVQFCDRIRILKMSQDFDPIKILIHSTRWPWIV